jgi:putative ABC transport system permease protein
VYTQLGFMKNKDLGFDKEQKLYISWSRNSSISENYNTVKAEFSQLSGVKGATVSSAIPGYGIYGWQLGIVGETDSKMQFFNVCLIDDDFIPEFKIEMAAGRAFMKELNTDIEGPLIINETAVKSLGWQSPEEALGKKLRGGPADGQVIGVMKDFHFSDVQRKIGPIVMVYSPEYFDCITLTIDAVNPEKTISLVKKKWQELNPGGLFTYRFIDSIFELFYRSNERTGRLFGIFTFLGIFISCLGLFGLVSYTAEKRTKEIGIRKVLGASVTGIAVHLSKEFIRLVALAIIVAMPLAYFAMDKWLQNFAYRVNISVWIFVLSAVITMVIAFVSVSFQTIKAATANPVDSLKYE